MHREDNSKFLLFIEPGRADKSDEPVNDEWTDMIEELLKTAKKGTSDYDILAPGADHGFDEGNAWRGMHSGPDGMMSSNKEYLLPGGYITNSLAPHYLRYYRKRISDFDWKKLEDIKSIVEKGGIQ